MKFVRFNLNIAEYRAGQIIPYHELSPGQKFWVDNEDILGSERIAHFCDKDGKTIDPDVELDEIAPEETAPEETATEESGVDETAPDETASEETEEATVEKKLNLDFAAEDDQSKQAETEAADGTCLGVKADGSGCNNKVGDSGYCFRHIDQS